MLMTSTLLERSIETAQSIFNRSENLQSVNADADIYEDRIQYLKDLLGEEGHLSFNPFVAKDLTIDFNKNLKTARKQVYENYYHKNYDSYSDEMIARNEYYISDSLPSYVTNEHLLSNKVPEKIMGDIKRYEMKGYSSPKLSKLLVKLYGQDSDVVKWFTNQCPKKLDKGLIEDYKVHLSILPHHIAGMSYYAPYNTGGDRWETGWNKTSCMDTIRNGDGSSIYQLVPNLLDTTLAVAYLTKADNNDLFEPAYQARLLVRVAKVNDNDYIMLGLRPFYTNNETKNYLVEGLKSEFENFVLAEDLRTEYKTNRDMESFRTDIEVAWETSGARETCDDCDGDGVDYYDDSCSTCDGSGHVTVDNETYYPYIDDPDFVTVDEGNVEINLPRAYLVKMGYMEEPEKEVLPTFSRIALAC